VASEEDDDDDKFETGIDDESENVLL